MSSTKKSFLAFSDLVLFLIAFQVIYSLRFQVEPFAILSSLGLWMAGTFAVLSIYVFGGYDFEAGSERWVYWRRLFTAVMIGFAMIVSIHYFLAKDRSGIFGRGVFIGSLILYTFFLGLSRLVVVSALSRIKGKRKWLLVFEPDMIPGARESLRMILPETESAEWVNPGAGVKSALESNSWFGIILQNSPEIHSRYGEALLQSRVRGQRVLTMADVYEEYSRKIPVETIRAEELALSEGFTSFRKPFRMRLKRVMDIFLSFLLLILTSPLMLLAVILIRLESKGPALYRQVRTGMGGLPFTIVKFRSMRIDAESEGAQWARKNDSRITRVGALLRKTRIDELPQLWNVIRGEMSFVGPRPERPEFNGELREKIPFYDLRHLVSPGLTGWAQVMYPYGASVEDSKRKLEYDLFYIKHHSLFFDFQILLRTVRVVLFAAGR